MLTDEQAAILTTLLEVATDGNWPQVAAAIQDRGYKPAEVVEAWDALCDIAGQSTAVDVGDF